MCAGYEPVEFKLFNIITPKLDPLNFS